MIDYESIIEKLVNEINESVEEMTQWNNYLENQLKKIIVYEGILQANMTKESLSPDLTYKSQNLSKGNVIELYTCISQILIYY